MKIAPRFAGVAGKRVALAVGAGSMIQTVVVGHGLAGGRSIVPLIRRQPELRLHGVVARDPEVRAEAVARSGRCGASPAWTRRWTTRGPARRHRDAARHARRAGGPGARGGQALRRGQGDGPLDGRGRPDDRRPRRARGGCSRSSTTGAGIGTSDAQGRAGRGLDRPPPAVRELGLPLLPRRGPGGARPTRRARSCTTGVPTWSTRPSSSAWARAGGWRPGCSTAPWPGVDSGGHGRIVMEFDGAHLPGRDQPRLPDRPPALVDRGDRRRLRQVRDRSPGRRPPRGDIDRAAEPESHQGLLRTGADGAVVETARFPRSEPTGTATTRNIADHLLGRQPLAVTAEQGREVVRVLEAAVISSREHSFVEGPWGT